ncbi:MAG: hypothetical protein J2P37_08695 [Ktedonobacteraceae bacterium]|nr:hypothetical protein [Ktedonobacteraceae bacterium]
MNTRPLELAPNLNNAVTETEELTLYGFTQEEVISLLWLRQWYQNGGSDRMEVVRRLEFTRHLVKHGLLEP